MDATGSRSRRQSRLRSTRTQRSSRCRPGRRPQPTELDRLSQIIKTFNDQFGDIPWTDADRVHKLITEDIPSRVAADTAYQNAKRNSDRQNARIEHDKALARVMTAVLKDDTELFKQFMDNESFKRWLTDTVFDRRTTQWDVGRIADGCRRQAPAVYRISVVRTRSVRQPCSTMHPARSPGLS